MSVFVTTFGFDYGVIGKEENGQFIKIACNDLIEYGARTKRFKSNISFNGNDVIVGAAAKKGEIYIENVGLTFENEFGKEYSLNGKTLSIDDVVKAYFSKIKEQIDFKNENDSCDLIHIVIPYEFTILEKARLNSILTDINFPLGGLVEEPVASYFGYVKKNQLQYLEEDNFMMVNIDYDSIKVKIFDIEQVNQEFFCLDKHESNNKFAFYLDKYGLNNKFTFYLDSHESNNEFNIYSLLSKKILSLMEGDLKYNDLSSSDQKDLERVLQDLIDHFQNREEKTPYDFYIGLIDADAEFEETITRDQFIEMLQENIDILQETISKCMQNTLKSKGEIRKIIYTGDAREVYGLQETIDQEFDIDQEIMIGEDDLACLGAFEEWKNYKLRKRKKRNRYKKFTTEENYEKCGKVVDFIYDIFHDIETDSSQLPNRFKMYKNEEENIIYIYDTLKNVTYSKDIIQEALFEAKNVLIRKSSEVYLNKIGNQSGITSDVNRMSDDLNYLKAEIENLKNSQIQDINSIKQDIEYLLNHQNKEKEIPNYKDDICNLANKLDDLEKKINVIDKTVNHNKVITKGVILNHEKYMERKINDIMEQYALLKEEIDKLNEAKQDSDTQQYRRKFKTSDFLK